jgi:hypothetical protein
MARRALGRAIFALGVSGSLVVACTNPAARESGDAATKDAMIALVASPPELEHAESVVIAQCMALHGLRYPPLRLDPPKGWIRDITGLGAPMTIQEARTRGYGDRLLATSRNVDPQAATKRYKASLRPAKRHEYDGILDPRRPVIRLTLSDGWIVMASTKGCVARARRRLYGSVLNFLKVFYVPQEIWRFNDRMVASSVVQEALRIYATCMRREGYRANSPQRALTSAIQRFGHTRMWGDQISKQERALAVQDAKCQIDSHIYPVMHNALFSAAAEWLRRNQTLILTLASIQGLALMRARSVLWVSRSEEMLHRPPAPGLCAACRRNSSRGAGESVRERSDWSAVPLGSAHYVPS